MVVLHMFDDDHTAFLPKFLVVKQDMYSAESVATVVLENNSY